MGNSNSNGGAGGIGFCGVLTIVFVVLKLCDVIDWSWWWVLSPLWIALAVLLSIVMFLVLVIVAIRIGKAGWRLARSGSNNQ
jgi:hypothetical protein